MTLGLSTRLPAGKLRHQIDIVAPSNVQGASGEVSLNNNILVANVWAAIEGVTGRDALAVGEFVSQATHKITIRYMPGISSRMQVWFNGRQFQIQYILNPDERTKMLYLFCLEIADSSQQPNLQSGNLS